MSDERKESLFIVSYSGRDTADEAYDTLRQMEKDNTGMALSGDDWNSIRI